MRYQHISGAGPTPGKRLNPRSLVKRIPGGNFNQQLYVKVRLNHKAPPLLITVVGSGPDHGPEPLYRRVVKEQEPFPASKDVKSRLYPFSIYLAR